MQNIYMRIEKHPTLLEEAARAARAADTHAGRSAIGEPFRKFLARVFPPSWLI